MDNNDTTVAKDVTETPQASESSSKLDIRGSLSENFNKADDDKRYSKSDTAAEPTAVKVERELERIEVDSIPKAVAPPSDMNKAEREAFLKPTADNAHVLQAYLSRRSYETRADYERRRVELDRLQKQTEAMANVYEEAKKTYSDMQLDPLLVIQNAMKWDVALRDNPTEAALEYLENYGVTPEELYQRWQEQQQNAQYPQYQQGYPQEGYLTKEEAERIAEEKIQALMSQQHQEVVAQQNLATVQSFMSSKPLFTATDSQTAAQLEEKMAPVVAALTQQGGSSQSDILETAYNYVVNGDPVFSDLARKLDAAQKVTTQTRETAKAKHASRSISGSVGSGSPRMAIKDIRENLRRRLNGID